MNSTLLSIIKSKFEKVCNQIKETKNKYRIIICEKLFLVIKL